MNRRVKIVSLYGRDKVGKTTIASALKERLGPSAILISFSDELRKEIEMFYGIPRCYTVDEDKKETIIRLGDFPYTEEMKEKWKFYNINIITDFDNVKITPRKLMHVHSFYIRRKENVDWLVDAYNDKIENLSGDIQYVITDDCRPANELKLINSLNSRLFFLNNRKDLFGPSYKNILEEDLIKYIEKHFDSFICIQMKIPVDSENIETALKTIQERL